MSLLIDKVAEVLHDEWWSYQARNGRTLGPCRTKETHPHMVPWGACGLDNNNQDRYQACRVLHFVGHRPDLDLGAQETWMEVARVVHEATSEVMKLQGRGDRPQCGPWDAAHAEGPGEHLDQARGVCRLLASERFLPGAFA